LLRHISENEAIRVDGLKYNVAQGGNEAFSRVVIDALLADVGWNLTDGRSVRYEYPLANSTRADYVLSDRNGRALAVIEAKRFSVNPADAAAQGRAYAEQLGVPFVFLSNGNEIRFWDYANEAHPRPVKTFFSQDNLERRAATRKLRTDPLKIPIDRKIVDRDYQVECIDTLCREIARGRQKLLVEMATGTGKTRMAAAFIKRLFEANAVTRVLFLVDRIPLAMQTEDAFTEHLRDFPCYVLRAGRSFQDEKRVTITTLQSMINIYRNYSAGYFDLVISDECHRSIYGKWKSVLLHFDAIQLGLTATPCVTEELRTGDDEDQLFVRDTLRFFEVEKPTYTYLLRQAIRDGWLAPYQIYKAKTVKTAAEGGFEVRRDEIQWDELDDKTRGELDQAFGGRDSIMVDPTALERRFTIPERNRAIVREFRQVMENGYTDAKGVLRKPLIGKTLVFAVTKRHAETLARLLDETFADKKPSPEIRYADYVVSGFGPEDTTDAMTKIRRFRKAQEQFPQIMVSVNMLDTGFDCPELMNLVFARFTKSLILYRQMRGRGTRKAHGKPVFTMFDFVGVTDYHEDEETYGEGGQLAGDRTRPRSHPRALVVVDTDDHIDPATREWITVDENGNLEFPLASEIRQSELGLRFEAWLDEQDLSRDQLRLLKVVGEQIRANAEQWNEFTPDHFEVWSARGRWDRRRAVELFGDEKRLADLCAGMSHAVFGDGGARAAH
jgi:type I restriction enzyme R subunit